MANDEEQAVDDLLSSLPEQPKVLRLADGDVLVEQHTAGSEVYIVLSGVLVASIDAGDDVGMARVATFTEGDLIGELTALTGGLRTATVTSNGAAEVAEIDRAAFVGWLSGRPEHSERVAAAARDRIDRNRATALIARILGTDDPAMLELAAASVEWRTLEPGDVLCTEGELSDAAYLILSGRVGVTSTRTTGDRTVELGRNQIVGELGVLDRLPRTATVTALRRTRLGQLHADALDRLNQQAPEIGLHLFRQALARAVAPDERSDVAGMIGLIPSATGHEALITSMIDELRKHGSATVVTAEVIDERFGPEASLAAPGSIGASRILGHLHDLENTHDHVLLVGDPESSAWTRHVAESSDRVMVLVPSTPSSDDRLRLHRLRETLDDMGIGAWQGILHIDDTRQPPRRPDAFVRAERTLHLRTGNATDHRRVARLLSGNGVALVLGGGGARGFGHIGAYQALLEHGIEPDAVYGSSIGSVIAATIALDYGVEDIIDACETAFAGLLDWTLPLVAFLRGRKITEAIDDALGDFRCEDLWRPFVCTATNLTQSRLEVVDSGPLGRAVRTSVSIPGVLPPIAQGGDVLVDGGVLNNLPADLAAADPVIRTVWALDVSPPLGPRAKKPFEPQVSGFRLLARQLLRRPSTGHPGAAGVVMQTMVAGASRDRWRMTADGTIDHYLPLEIRDSGLLDFENVRPTVEAGYRSAVDHIPELLAQTTGTPAMASEIASSDRS